MTSCALLQVRPERLGKAIIVLPVFSRSEPDQRADTGGGSLNAEYQRRRGAIMVKLLGEH